jgi:hypothetical protein
MVHIVRTGWNGTSGGPGLTQLAIDTTDSTFGPLSAGQAQSAVDAVRTFWSSLVNQIPDEIQLTVSPVVDYYLVHNGQLAGSVSATTAPAVVVGASAAAYSMATGPKVNLNTGVIRNGRRVRGAIYIVPGSAATYGTNGQLAATARTAINTAGATLRNSLSAAGLKLGVWSRPIPEGKKYGPRDGAWSDVQSFETNEKLAILRGRRD